MAKIEGKVVAIEPSGNLRTDIAVDRLRGAPTDDRVKVCCDEHETTGLFPLEHGQPPMTLLALIGASGFLELCIVGDSAAIMLGVRVGEGVVVEW